MKKILSFVLVLVLAAQFAVMPASAASKNTEMEKKLLTQLEIIPKDLKDASGLSRMEFAKVISNMILFENKIVQGVGETMYIDVPHTDDAAIVINTVTSHGIMSGVGDGRFDPDSLVTLDQAVAAVVNMLGYKNAALSLGGFPVGYRNIATDIGLFKGVNLNEDTITVGNLKALLANALATDVMLMTGVGENQKFEILKDEPFMTYTMGLKKVSGVVRGTAISAIADESFTGFGEVNINGTVYGIGNFNANDFVGYYVDACFIDEDDTDYQEIVYMSKVKDKNETFVIYADEFKEYNGNEIVYIKDGETRRQKEYIEEDADVMYNGHPLATYTEDDFKLKDGVITLIDNSGNGRFDIVSITEYETTVVKSVNIEKKKIIDRFTSLNDADFGKADDEALKIVDTKGGKLEFENIMPGDVVTWYVDKAGELYTLVVASGNTVLGTITGKDFDEGIVYIDEEKYFISPEYTADRYKAEIKFNKAGTFYLDYLDRVVGFDSGEGVTEEWAYGWLLKPIYNEDDDSYMLKVCTQEGTIQYLTVAERFDLDFNRVKEEDRAVVMNITPGVIKYMVNMAEEITKIDTVEPDGEEDSLANVYSGSTSWKGMGTDTFSDVIIADAETVVFVPKAGSTTEYDVTNRGYFITDKSYPITVYAKKGSKVADAIVVGAESDGTEKVGALIDIITTLNDEGEAGYRIKLRDAYDIGKELTLWSAEGATISGVKRGDIVGYKLNGSQQVTSLRTLFDPETSERAAFATLSSGISAGNIRYIMGKVGEIQDGNYMLVVDEEATKLDGDYKIYSLPFAKSRSMIYKYDESLPEKFVTAEPSEIFDYDTVKDSCSRVLITSSTGWLSSIIIFNDIN